MFAIYLVLTMVMGWRLVGVQVVSAAEYQGLADRQTQRVLELPAPRGKLYDRTGEPLALSLSSATVYAHPRILDRAEDEPAAVAAELAPVLDADIGTLTERLASDAGFVYLARQVPREVGEQVTELALPGVAVLDEPRRVYPADGLAAQVLGFAGIDHTGLSGLEAAYDEQLAGTPGELRTERAPGGLTISAAPREVVPAVPGRDLVLTLDRDIQAATEGVLADAVEEYDAKGASAVVLDVRTGEVLAMASAPGYGVAEVADVDAYVRRNRAVTDIVEPGSVSKVVTVAAALEAGVIGADQHLTVPDHYQVGPKRFRDAHAHDPQHMSVTDIMVTSSNVGTIKIAERLGAEGLYDGLRSFGFGQATGIEFPGESPGLLAAPERWSQTSLPTIAIGQGVSASLLQVAGVYRTIADDGQWMAPSLLRGTVDGNGELDEAAPPERRRAVSPETAATVQRMLADVVSSDEGTGQLAAVAGHVVGGKTGTAQKPSETHRGYEEGAYIGTFAGFGPAHDPQVVVAVMVDEPTPIYGGLTAAPVFRDIMGFTLGHRRVSPTEPAEVRPEAAILQDDPAIDEGPDEVPLDAPVADPDG